jgi:hypothetical protein
VIDQQPPHDGGRDAKKLCTVLPLDAVLRGEPQIDLVHQGRGAKRVIRSLAGQVASRLLSQLFVNERDQLLGGFGITGAPGPE